MKQVEAERGRETTILVIVYERIVRDILARILTAQGHKVVACSVGFDGIRRFEKGKGKFHLVMVDSNLPDVSGLVVAKKIKTITQKTPVMLIRGWDRNVDVEELKGSGVDYIMSRPFYMDKTLNLIENALLTVHQ
jgi:DNA-binding response OmpR family regulator